MTKKIHSCDTCGKSYSRAEHLQRHADSHKNFKPWHCQFCSKYFVRRDVLNRHFKSCVPAARGARAQGGRINRACQNCKERKVKCSGGQPCTLCSKYPVACVYTLHGASPFVRRHSAASSIGTPTTETGTSPSKTSAPAQTIAHLQRSFSAIEGMQGPPFGRVNLQETSNIRRSDHEMKRSYSHIPKQTVTDHPVYRPSSARDSWSSNNGFRVYDWFFVDSQKNGQVHPPSLQRQSSSSERSNSDSLRDSSSAMDKLSIGSSQSSASPESPPRFTIDMSQINPLEHHRTKILRFLEGVEGIRPQHIRWLTLESMGDLLKTYFLRHNQHTPIIHLPRWSVATCETSLIFAIMIVGMSCLPDTRNVLDDTGTLLRAAYDFAMRPMFQDRSRTMSLESLQALVFLAMVDKLMLNESRLKSHVDIAHVVALARAAKFFDEEPRSTNGSPSELSWQEWAHFESRRRTAFVLYSFDAFISCLEDQRPLIATTEMSIRMPSPEALFLAESADEWARLRGHVMSTDRPSFSVLMSLLLSDFSSQAELPPTLMGGFAVLHGILTYAWETRKTYRQELERCNPSDRQIIGAFLKTRYDKIQEALRVWCRSWTATLESPICDASTSTNLYKDRALVYWYLTGVLSISETEIQSSNSPTSREADLSFQVLLQRLIVAYDKGQLVPCAGDFFAARQLVIRAPMSEATRIPIGSLLYREPEAISAA